MNIILKRDYLIFFKQNSNLNAKNILMSSEDLKETQRKLQEVAKSLQDKIDASTKSETVPVIPSEIIEKIRHQFIVTLSHNQEVIESSKVSPEDYAIYYSYKAKL